MATSLDETHGGNDPNIVQAVYPGTPPATNITSQVIVIDVVTGKKVMLKEFPSYARPSSITVAKGRMFPPSTALVTDAIGVGGLCLIRP